MNHVPSRVRDISFWYYQFAGWILYATLQIALNIGWNGLRWRALLSISIQLIAIFFLLLGLRQYYRTLPFQSMPLFPLIRSIFVTSFLAMLLWLCIWAGIEYTVFGEKLLMYIMNPLHIVSQMAYSFPIFLGWSALYFGIKAWRDWLDEQDHTRQAMEAAQQAQLQMLRYQLNPHFLFNALNAVRALVDEDTRNAKTMITELSEFLRYSLMSRNKQIVPLKDELDAIKLYLSIEQQRYEDKLQVSFDIDHRTEDVPVPSFLIHPIVEHALRCGMQTSSMPLRLTIHSCLVNNRLRMTIMHSGYNLPTNGIGAHESSLEHVETRLQDLFPGQYRLSTSQQDDHAQTILELAITNGITHEEKVAGNYHR
jgi:two-component system, LytTR family, sensor kinase